MNTHPGTIVHILQGLAEQQPDSPALIAPNAPPLSYKSLLTFIKQTHHALNALGLGTSSCIASVMPNTPEAATAFIAISASCTFAPFNPAYTAEELESYFVGLNVSAVLTLRGFGEAARTVANKLHIPLLECVPDHEKGVGQFALMGETGLIGADFGYANPEDFLMVLHTSGSTSTPKIVPIQQSSLCLALQTSTKHRQITAKDRCLNALPLFHLQGLLVVLYPLIVGGSCVYAFPFEPKRFMDWLGEFDPSFYSATPAMHKLLLEQAQQTESFRKNPSLRFISSSSAPLPLSEINALETMFGVPLIESYGMTETLNISSNPLPPKIRKQGSVGVSVNNDISILDDDFQTLPVGQIGQIVVQSPWLMKGYIHQGDASDNPFCANGFCTGDLGYLDEDGYLFITGRVKEIINRGGEKITPGEVERVLSSYPDVKEAICFPVPHSALGENIAAVVVPHEHRPIEPETLKDFARQKLAEFKIPYHIIISDHLPRGATGKIQRHKMAGYFAGQLPAHENQHRRDTLATTPFQEKLLIIWQKTLNQGQIGIHDNFFELGGHSLLATLVCAEMEVQLKRPIPVALLYRLPTISRLAETLEHYDKPNDLRSTSSIVTAFNMAGPKKPIFCFCGGRAIPAFLEQFGIGRPLYFLNHQSFDGRKAKYLTVPDMARYYVQCIMEIDAKGPYYLLAYSMGAIIFYEVARQLCEQGKKIELLFLLDPAPLGFHIDDPQYLSHNKSFLNSHFFSHYKQIRQLGFSDYFFRKIQRVKNHLTLNACFLLDKPFPSTLHWHYLGGLYIQARSAYQASKMPETIEKVVVIYITDNYGIHDWNSLLDNKHEQHIINCGHLELIEAPHRALWLTILGQVISNIEEKPHFE